MRGSTFERLFCCSQARSLQLAARRMDPTGARLDFFVTLQLAACSSQLAGPKPQVRGSTFCCSQARSSQLAARRMDTTGARVDFFCEFAACSLQLAARRMDTTRKSPGQINLTFCEQLSVCFARQRAPMAPMCKLQRARCKVQAVAPHIPLIHTSL